MPRPARQRRQYAPVRFGEPYDPRSVEGHRNAVLEAREVREFREMKRRRVDAEAAARPWHEKLLHSMVTKCTPSMQPRTLRLKAGEDTSLVLLA